MDFLLLLTMEFRADFNVDHFQRILSLIEVRQSLCHALVLLIYQLYDWMTKSIMAIIGELQIPPG